MKFFFFGDDWAPHLAAMINQHEGRHSAKAVEYPCVNPIKLAMAMIWCDAAIRVGVRPGAKGKRLLLLDIVWAAFCLIKGMRRSIIYWIGSDVLSRIESTSKPGLLDRIISSHSLHWSNAPWLKEELLTVGINSSVVLFPAGKVSISNEAAPPLPDSFSVITYIPDGRSDFFGGNIVVALASAFPHIHFTVFGGKGSWMDFSGKPSNLTFLGFVSNVKDLFARSTVVLRLVKHDAIGGTVREGLAFARHVLYSYPLPHCRHVAFNDFTACQLALEELHELHSSNRLKPNLEGAEYARREYDSARLLNQFINAAEQS